jgi:ElaB/YqjD/DUF883 family membrane-anchored ribosome-binding protein
LSIPDEAQAGQTLEDLRKQLAALNEQINDLAGSGLGKATAQIRGRPLEAVLIALGIGLIGGYLLKS